MPKITNFIGQVSAVNEINEIIEAKDRHDAKGEPFKFRPILLKGLTGLGKTELAELIARNMGGMNFLEVPPNAGWGEMSKMADKMASFDEDKKRFSAIPMVAIIDEAHTQKTCGDFLKVLFNDKGEPKHISRTGRDYYYDPYFHLPIFASNRTLDAALEGRCYKIQLVPYNKSEKIRLIRKFGQDAGVEFSAEACELLEGRVKPTAREIKDIVYPFTLMAGHKISAALALEKALAKGFFKLGLRKLDLAILKRICEGNATASVLKHVAQDDKKKDTQDKVDWLIALGLVEDGRGGFHISKNGVKYMNELSEAQKASKAAKAKSK